MRSVVQAYRGDHDERTPRLVSIATGAVICLFALWARVYWGAFLAALFTFMNVAALKQQRLPGREPRDAQASGHHAVVDCLV